MTIPTAPKGAQASGRRLWRAVLGVFELSEHELVLLRQAVRATDTCEALQALVDTEGLLLEGRRAHPALVELRQQRIGLARLITALRVPLGDTGTSPPAAPRRGQHRGTRGVYQLGGPPRGAA